LKHNTREKDDEDVLGASVLHSRKICTSSLCYAAMQIMKNWVKHADDDVLHSFDIKFRILINMQRTVIGWCDVDREVSGIVSLTSNFYRLI
jgi:hypothetical protein